MKNPYLAHIKQMQKEFETKIINDFGQIALSAIGDDYNLLIKKNLQIRGLKKDGHIVSTDMAIEQGRKYNYAHSTIFYKKPTNNFRGKIQKGLEYRHVTLNNLGFFYKSISTNKYKKHLIITANFLKSKTLGGETIHIYRNFHKTFASQSDFERAVLSLSPETMRMLVSQKIQPAIFRRLRNR